MLWLVTRCYIITAIVILNQENVAITQQAVTNHSKTMNLKWVTVSNGSGTSPRFVCQCLSVRRRACQRNQPKGICQSDDVTARQVCVAYTYTHTQTCLAVTSRLWQIPLGWFCWQARLLTDNDPSRGSHPNWRQKWENSVACFFPVTFVPVSDGGIVSCSDCRSCLSDRINTGSYLFRIPKIPVVLFQWQTFHCGELYGLADSCVPFIVPL